MTIPPHRRLLRWTLAGVLTVMVLLVPTRAPATITEQRQRLPPPAYCDDPVEGIWKSHQYDPQFRDWYIFTLEIHRDESNPNQLTGSIRAHSWEGTPQDQEPPTCSPGPRDDHWTVMMEATGTTNPATGDVHFGGTSWRHENLYCGNRPWSYNLDQFSGTIDAEIQEFQSVNNDGGRARNVPTVFRRIRCFDDTLPAPSVNPTPPAFYPDQHRGGCSFF